MASIEEWDNEASMKGKDRSSRMSMEQYCGGAWVGLLDAEHDTRA
jgi:hypothetical protein